MTSHAFAPTFDIANPFLAPRVALHEAPCAEAAEPSFALVRSGPPVPEDEVESHLDAVEVTVRWGAQVLSVAHLPRGKAFWVGDGSEIALPEDALGAARAPIVVPSGEGAYAVVPPNAGGTVTARGAEPESIAALVARGALPGATEIAGGHVLSLAPGMKVTLEVGAVTFDIATVRAGKVAPIGFLGALASGALGFVGLSALGHGAIVASLAMFVPSMGADDADAMDRDQLLLMQKYLNASAVREQEPPKDMTDEAGDAPAGGGSQGEAHKGESGVAGTTRPKMAKGHMAFKGNDDERQLRRLEDKQLAETFGMVAMLTGAADPNAPASPWAKEYKGMDEVSARGAMFGDTVGEVAGTGLGLWGTGLGGGGTADVLGDGNVHTVGGGGGGKGPWGLGDKDGLGIGHGPGHGGHPVKVPRMRPIDFSSNGRLPAEVIQRVVRQNFGRFRLCYENGLRGNPSLSGRVTTRFVIDRNGGVASAQDAGSDLPDQKVVQCIVRSFGALSFPSPEGGIATVTYPIALTPGE